MTYQEVETLVNNHLTNVDPDLKYYYINYLYVTSNHHLLPQKESIEDLLKKANIHGRHLNFYDYHDKKYQNMGPNVKGYVRVDTKSDTINVRCDLKDEAEKIIYHEIHHIMQIDEETLNVGIARNYYLKLINEAETEYIAEVVYNTVHNTTKEEQVHNTEDIFMHEGGKCLSSALSYQYFDNVLTKLCLLLGVKKDYFVHLNYEYLFGSDLFKDSLACKINEYNQHASGIKYVIEVDDIIDLMNDITATYYHIYYNKPKDIDFFYIRDNYNNLYCVSPRELSNMVDALDIYLFELIVDQNIKREFIKYAINSRIREQFYNEVTYNIKTLTKDKFLEIKC